MKLTADAEERWQWSLTDAVCDAIEKTIRDGPRGESISRSVRLVNAVPGVRLPPGHVFFRSG